MTILTSANGSLPLTLRKGETLVIRNYSGSDVVSGSTVLRETVGDGSVIYGPQTSDATVNLSSTGQLDYITVMGDPTPTTTPSLIVRDSAGLPTGLIDPVTGQAVGARYVRPKLYGRLPIGRDTEAVGTAVHQHRYYVPFGGQTVQVRCVYRNTATGTQMITADSAVASGRSFNDLNPISETGAAVPFVAVGSGKTIDVAPSASVSRLGRSEWMTVRVIEDAARPGWGTLYVRSRFTSGGLAVRYEGGTGQDPFNAAAKLFKHIADFQTLAAIGDNIGAGTLNDYRRAFWIEVRALKGQVGTVAAFGDSRVSGFGSAGNMHGWASRACEDLNAAGVFVGFENWGQASTNSASYMDRLNGRLALGDCPDVVLWQVGSNNDAGAWTEATVSSSIARMIEAKEKVEALGGIFIPCTMFPSSGANTADKVAQWRRLNDAARACRFYVDFDVQPINNGAEIPAIPSEFTVDGVHLNDTWQQFLANIAAPVIRLACA